VLIIGAASVLAMLGYVGGPLPYGYRGLGEIFVFLFFGVVATAGSRYVHDGSIPVDTWLLSIPVGFLVTAILVVNNLRDINTDARTGKRTLAVLIGKGRTRLLYIALVVGAFIAIGLFAGAGLTPAATALALVLAPFALPLVLTVRSTEEGPRLVQVLKGTALLHLAVGLALMGGSML
jgi:1,4-dihydroxy-2-naphthoate polyprenyltransferase